MSEDYSCPRGEGEYCELAMAGACAFGPECEHDGKTRAEKEAIWQERHEARCDEILAQIHTSVDGDDHA